jgi:phage terminase small subunit
MSNLTPAQALFVQEYLVDLNATQAAIRAKYAPESAAVQGHRLVRKANVASAIQQAMDARAARTNVTQDRVIAELAKLGFANMADYMRTTSQGDPYLDLSNLSRDQSAAIAEVTVDDYVEGRGEDARSVKRVRVKLADKRAALVDIGRHLGMFRDKIEMSGPNGGPIPLAVNVASLTDEQLAAALAGAAGAAEAGAGKAPEDEDTGA